MDWTLEVVQVPVTDVDRAKRFYVDCLGFAVDFDETFEGGRRLAQLTPPGSGCSIHLSTGIPHGMAPGSMSGMVLVVPDVRAADAELARRGHRSAGVEVTRDGVSFRPAVDGEPLDDVGFLRLRDPDGNRWAVQQISRRARTYDLVMSRTFDVAVDEAWTAWTSAEQVRRWWGPRGWTVPVAEMDVREGGTSLIGMRARAEGGAVEVFTTWTYTQVIAPRRLEFDLVFTDVDRNPVGEALRPPGVPGRVRHLVTLDPTEDGGTEMTVFEFGYESLEAREMSAAGLEQCLDKMSTVLQPS